MSAQDFLVELGTEELPPKALKSLGDAFLAGILGGLKTAGLSHGTARVYAAPRRLAVLVEQLATQQPDRSVNLDGPPLQAAFDAAGNPTQAALGFAKKCGVDLAQIDTSGPKLKFSQTIPGQPAKGLLAGIVEASLAALPIPKRMRWAARREEFVRPTQWLVMLFGDDVVDCEILAQKAGRESRGHRFHNPANIRISKPSSYLEDLRAAYVLADFAERRELIAKRVDQLAAEQKGSAVVPADLLDEVTALVEWPVPLVCSFEERFLEVPQEALITTMQDNQKYFCLLDANGKLLPRFITVANVESKDPAQIISGNEKVVRPRLTDAEFFFKQDKKQKLETFNERLKNVVFQAQLGTVYEKAERVSALAAHIAERVGADPVKAARAGILAKCDLATEMVGEFPEMQGIAGYYYALNDGEADDVAHALNEQYMPRGAGAELPQTLTGAALAVADKLDTLVGIFGIGMLPTGSKDPFALRRQALGVLRILIEKKLDLDLDDAVGFAIAQYGDKVKADGLAPRCWTSSSTACAPATKTKAWMWRCTSPSVPSSRPRPWTSTSACKPCRPSAPCPKPQPWPPPTSASPTCWARPKAKYRPWSTAPCCRKTPRRHLPQPWQRPSVPWPPWQPPVATAKPWAAWRACANRWMRSSRQ